MLDMLFGKRKTPDGESTNNPRSFVSNLGNFACSASSSFPSPTPSSELLRENKRQLDKAIRDLDRERMGLQNQEKKVVLEIKKMAKEGQTVRTLRALANILSEFV